MVTRKNSLESETQYDSKQIGNNLSQNNNKTVPPCSNGNSLAVLHDNTDVPTGCLRVIHFNDVYEIEDRDESHPGAATFAKRMKEYYTDDCLVLFSGDALSPSEVSASTRGAHMIDVFNLLKVDAAVFGNHEFDFGIENLREVIRKMNFPWLISNLTDRRTGEEVAKTRTNGKFDSGIRKLIIKRTLHSGQDIKIGLVGLIEPDWIETLPQIAEAEFFQYQDYVETANDLVSELKDDGAQLIIALTHMREPNDIRLAREVDGLDLILGGHDHHYIYSMHDHIPLIKSGSEFREFSVIDLEIQPGKIRHTAKRVEISSGSPVDKKMQKIIDKYTEKQRKFRSQPLISIETPLDTRFQRIRTQETNFGSFTADIMRDITGCEIALINSGTFRSDKKFDQSNPLTVGDMNSIFPILDRIVKLKVNGSQLLTALENSVSKYPTTAGRFFQVSGLKFSFDPATEPRIQTVFVNSELLDMKREYSIATKAYIANGNDGYEVFLDKEVWKEPCQTEAELNNLPNLKFVMIDKLQDYKKAGKALHVVPDGRILNLEKFSVPNSSSSQSLKLSRQSSTFAAN